MKAEDSGKLYECVLVLLSKEQKLDSKCSDMAETHLDRWGDKHDGFDDSISIKVETYLFD